MRATAPIRAAVTASLAAAALLLVGCSQAAPEASAPAGSEPAATGSGLETITPGVLTIGTGEPAYEPWVVGDDPESGEGFEAAVAYALAEQLGYSADEVVWVRTTFDQAIQPGPKDFDLNIQQFSITEERAANVDFSSPYYTTSQVVVSNGAAAVEGATSLADLQGAAIGAMSGTTSFTAAEQHIAPAGGVQAFTSNDDAVLALQTGAVDAIVVDLPTAFYLVAAELDAGSIVGQLPDTEGAADEFGAVLELGSPLTQPVSEAIDALAADGTLDELEATWLTDAGDAPLLG